MLSLVPKNKAKEVESKGIMEVTQPTRVSAFTYSVKDGLHERVYKIFCNYQIEQERFFHAVESKHVIMKFGTDICDSIASSQYAESGYCSESANSDESNLFVPVDAKEMMQSTKLAQSHMVPALAQSQEEDSGETDQGQGED